MKLYIEYFQKHFWHGLVFIIMLAGLIFGCEVNRRSFCRLGCACEPNVNRSPISSNLVDFTDPPSGDIIAPNRVAEVKFYFLKEINTATFSLQEDIISEDEGGNPGLSFAGIRWEAQQNPYVPNVILVLVVDPNSVAVDKCYYITLKQGSISSVDGTVLNSDVVVSFKTKTPDSDLPYIASFPSISGFLPPHQVLRYRFSEPMGAISLLIDPPDGIKADPILEVHDTSIDNMGVVIYGENNQGFKLGTKYDITFLSEDITLKQRNGLPATQDVSGNPLSFPPLLCLFCQNCPNLFCGYNLCAECQLGPGAHSSMFRFETSHVKFLTPLMDYKNDTPYFVDSLPLYTRILGSNRVQQVTLQSDTAETPVSITGFSESPDGRIFEQNFYFKSPGTRTLTAHGYTPSGYGGSDYVKVDVQPPERLAMLFTSIVDTNNPQNIISCIDGYIDAIGGQRILWIKPDGLVSPLVTSMCKIINGYVNPNNPLTPCIPVQAPCSCSIYEDASSPCWQNCPAFLNCNQPFDPDDFKEDESDECLKKYEIRDGELHLDSGAISITFSTFDELLWNTLYPECTNNCAEICGAQCGNDNICRYSCFYTKISPWTEG